MPNAFTTVRLRIEHAYERGNAWVKKLLAQVRPRVSLLSGSVLVLLTLFLPIGYEACGPPRTGYQLIRGKGDWPTLLGISSSTAGRGFYLAVLLLASFALLLVLVSAVRSGVVLSDRLAGRLAVLAGTVSLFLISDITLFLPLAAEGRSGSVALIALVVSCLTPGLFWPRKGFIAWVSAIASAVSLLFILDALGMSGGRINWMVFGTEAVYSLVPLGLWYRYGFPSRPEMRVRWEMIRRGLVALYFPATLGNFWFFRIAVKEGVWGFIPCYFGVHLMALGYLRLLKEIPSSRRNPTEGTRGMITR